MFDQNTATATIAKYRWGNLNQLNISTGPSNFEPVRLPSVRCLPKPQAKAGQNKK